MTPKERAAKVMVEYLGGFSNKRLEGYIVDALTAAIADAWDEGYESGRHDGWRAADFTRPDRSESTKNPYRKGTL